MRGLEGKVALVAGAAPGNIGAATAVRLAEEGTSVVVADLNESAARAVADEIQALGGKAIARSFDITDEASYKDLVDVTVKSSEGSTVCSTWPPTSRQRRWLKTVTCSRSRLRCGGTRSTSH
jgi:NAD(P)-dependent dehydrogenase (short-subunit alcohol dehydrogenase family)